MSIDRDTLLISAPEKQGGTGAAYIFTRRGTAWTEESILTASDGAVGDSFGATCLRGNTAVISAPNDEDFSGAVYIFVRRGENWIEQSKLVASNTRKGDQFGVSVSLNGDTLLVGGWQFQSGGTGLAYVFRPQDR